MMYPMFTYNTDQGVIGIQAENNVLVKVAGTDNIDFDEMPKIIERGTKF